MKFSTLSSLPLSAGQLDRAAHLRDDSDELSRLSASGRHVIVSKEGVLTTGDGEIYVAPDDPRLRAARDTAFLGVINGQGYFAHWCVDAVCDPAFGKVRSLRAAIADYSPDDLAVLSAAFGVLNWHQSHQFCAACGAPSALTDAGWRRLCGACGASHFPRTDPVVIMLVVEGENLLLARNAQWPEGMYSLLAGFMEPGESIEDAVRREALEESGVRIGAVRYVASQPWPFPSSLMIGAIGAAQNTDITLSDAELVDAFWADKQELAEIVAGRHARVHAPNTHSIAGILIRNWLADALSEDVLHS